ncbi:type II secretion system protein [Sulfurimonas sp. HSL-1716]|uniref:pilus assembly FimT family protein n=1 Tax=Hydrocurvibacter sulfurireducens TaxID=3131937 RepID=UPI0031F9C81F
MKRSAFTMLELVFVIVVIGILAAIFIPKFAQNKLSEAANQVISHIRYTQHLALMDDKYDANDAHWYQKRWQIFFAKTGGSGNKWAYTIYSDSNNYDGVPNPTEIALNPLDKTKRLTGGYSVGTVAYGDSDASDKLNLGNEYGITNITFSSNCSGSGLRISFDHLGRPMYDGPHKLDAPYTDGGASKLIQKDAGGNPCIITLTRSSESTQIAIEPETGYVHIQ